MRFLCVALVVLVSVSTPSLVSAGCTGDTGANRVPIGGVNGGTPSQNALPLFWTRSVSSGNFKNKVSGCGSAGGLPCIDAYCNQQSNSEFFPIGGVTPIVEARTGLYKAIISTPTIDAADRFADVQQQDIVDSKGECITSSVPSLFSAGAVDGSLGYNLNSHFFDNAGNGAPSDIISWSGSNHLGRRWKITGTPTEIAEAYCGTDNIGWNSVAGNTNVGIIFSQEHEHPQHWLGHGIGSAYPTSDGSPDGCSNGYHIMCLQASPDPDVTSPPASSVQGDPQFVGLQGQSFQVHGVPDEYFNLISLPDMQLNSRFAYLASGNCNYNNTACWTHPGTYVDQLGFMFPGLHIKAVAGTHDEGITVYVNERVIVAGPSSAHRVTVHGTNGTEQVITLSYTSFDHFVVSAPLFTISATNSDMFFNFGVALHSPSLLAAGAVKHHIKTPQDQNKYPQFPLHGLLGQTWKNARYAHGHDYIGQVDDYMLVDSQLFSTKFIFNQYKH